MKTHKSKNQTRNITFKIFTGAIHPRAEEHENISRHLLKGVASGTALDAEGDRMSEKALRKMESQIIGLTLHKDHIFKVDNTLGHFVNAKILSDTLGNVHELMVEAELEPFDVNPDAKKVYEKVKSGTRLGFSVAGLIKGWEKLEPTDGTERFLITDIELLSVDLVTVPAYRASQGSIMALDEISKDTLEVGDEFFICKEIGEILRNEIQSDEDDLTENLISHLKEKIFELELKIQELERRTVESLNKGFSETSDYETLIRRIERVEANVVEPPRSRGIMISRDGHKEITKDEADAFERGSIRLI